jgi:hypothetical protein
LGFNLAFLLKQNPSKMLNTAETAEVLEMLAAYQPIKDISSFASSKHLNLCNSFIKSFMLNDF